MGQLRVEWWMGFERAASGVLQGLEDLLQYISCSSLKVTVLVYGIFSPVLHLALVRS